MDRETTLYNLARAASRLHRLPRVWRPYIRPVQLSRDRRIYWPSEQITARGRVHQHAGRIQFGSVSIPILAVASWPWVSGQIDSDRLHEALRICSHHAELARRLSSAVQTVEQRCVSVILPDGEPWNVANVRRALIAEAKAMCEGLIRHGIPKMPPPTICSGVEAEVHAWCALVSRSRSVCVYNALDGTCKPVPISEPDQSARAIAKGILLATGMRPSAVAEAVMRMRAIRDGFRWIESMDRTDCPGWFSGRQPRDFDRAAILDLQDLAPAAVTLVLDPDISAHDALSACVKAALMEATQWAFPGRAIALHRPFPILRTRYRAAFWPHRDKAGLYWTDLFGFPKGFGLTATIPLYKVDEIAQEIIGAADGDPEVLAIAIRRIRFMANRLRALVEETDKT